MSGVGRQEWAQAIRAADLSMTARMVGQVLALDFANAATGQCNPSRTTLARHLRVSEATVKRALAELTKAGWLGRSIATARNRTASYSFLSPGKVVAFTPQTDANAGQKRPATNGRTRVKSAPNAGQICTRPYKGRNQVKNQSARDQQVTGCPVRQAVLIEAGSHREAAWNEYLHSEGWPSVAELGIRWSNADGAGWRMPFTMPPSRDDGTETRITEKYLNWASSKMLERRGRVA